MYARVLIATIEPEKLETLLSYRDSILIAVRQQRGFKNAFLLTDSSSGKVMYISWWETEADLQASETISREQLANVASLLTAPPVRETYEVHV